MFYSRQLKLSLQGESHFETNFFSKYFKTWRKILSLLIIILWHKTAHFHENQSISVFEKVAIVRRKSPVLKFCLQSDFHLFFIVYRTLRKTVTSNKLWIFLG